MTGRVASFTTTRMPLLAIRKAVNQCGLRSFAMTRTTARSLAPIDDRRSMTWLTGLGVALVLIYASIILVWAAAHLLPAILVSGEQCRANTRIVHIHRGEHIRPWHHVVGIRLNRTLSDNGLVRVAAPTIRDLMTITMAVQTTFCEWRHL